MNKIYERRDAEFLNNVGNPVVVKPQSKTPGRGSGRYQGDPQRMAWTPSSRQSPRSSFQWL